MRCIVLDGWHAGHVVMLTDAPPMIRLYRPRTVTWCACNSTGDPEEFDAGPRMDEYKIAMRPVVGDVAVYSTDGSSEALFRRDWIASARGLLAEPGPLWWNETVDVDCHDARAWCP